MSKNTIVKAATQGGADGGGSGPPGTWTLVASGQGSIGTTASSDLTTVPINPNYPADNVNYIPMVTMAVKAPGGDIVCGPGNVLADPPAGNIYYGLVASFTNDLTFRVRSKSLSQSVDFSWAIYKVVN